MKMSVGTRIIFSLFVLLMAAVCIFICLTSLGVLAEDDLLAMVGGITADNGLQYAWAAGTLVLAVVGLILLFFGIGKKKTPSQVMLVCGEGCQVLVSTEALRELAMRCLATNQELTVQKLQVLPGEERTAKLHMEAAVKAETVIPDVTAQVSQKLKEYFAQYCGLELVLVDIKILPARQQTVPQ